MELDRPVARPSWKLISDVAVSSLGGQAKLVWATLTADGPILAQRRVRLQESPCTDCSGDVREIVGAMLLMVLVLLLVDNTGRFGD